MQALRVGIVGMGIGRTNAMALARHPRGRVVALCDLLEDRMVEIAKDLPEPVKFFTDYQKMCADPDSTEELAALTIPFILSPASMRPRRPASLRARHAK